MATIIKNPKILKRQGAVSFYDYINKIPTYIHSTKTNFSLTSIEIKDNIPSKFDIKSIDYMNKIINIQRAREDDILIQLFGNKNCNIMEEFEKAGFILSDDKTQQILREIDKLKNYDRYKKWLEKYDFIKKKENLSIDELVREVKNTWDNYREKINNIEEVLNNILKDVDNSNISSDFISAKKRLDGLKDYDWNKNLTAQENMIEELRRTDGVISNIYKDITEGYRKKTVAQIKEEIKSDRNGYKFALLKEADEYRGEDKEVKRLAKSDQIIVKLEGETLIPIGGVTVKKSGVGTPKLHQTSSIQAFLDTMNSTDYIDDKEKKQDTNYLTYLLGNRLVYGAKEIPFLGENLQNIVKKYGLIFFIGTITKEILNLKNNEGIEILKINDIFNKEHADFLYITTNEGTTIKRASEELEQIYKKGISVNLSFGETSQQTPENILENVSEIKKKYEPYTYGIIVNNTSFKEEMDKFYNSIDDNLVIRLDSKKILIG